MRKLLPLAPLLAFFCGFTAPQPQRANGLYADVQTSKGLIIIALKPDAAPVAVASFVGLAEGTIANAALDAGQPYFDGAKFHRVVPGHVIQTGIPVSTRADGPGYSFPNEIDARLSHNHAGAVGMANSGPGTNGSQWYITLGNRSYLDGDYTVFGEVVAGMDVVLRIVQGDTVETVRIERVGAKAQAYHPTTASFQALVAAAQQRVTEQQAAKTKIEADWIERNYPHATGAPGGVLTQPLPGNAAPPPAGDGGALRVRYTGRVVRYVGDWSHRSGPALQFIAFGSGNNGAPGFHDPAEAFTYVPGQTRLNPGLTQALARMKPGERETVIVPVALGYGRSGFYAPDVAGQPRFVISPNSLLVYEVEILSGN